MDTVTILQRLFHAKRDITLRIPAHVFQKNDGKAAAAITAAPGSYGFGGNRVLASLFVLRKTMLST